MGSESSLDLLGKVATHIWSMAHWQRGLFTAAVAMLLGGSISHLTAPDAAPVPAPAPAVVDSSRSGLKHPGIPDAQAPAPQQPEPTFRQWVSPRMIRIGASLLGGFLIGFGLRVFLRLTALLLAVGAAIMMALSYFNVMNVDLTAAKTKYESSVHWAEDQAYRLKDSAQSHLPSSGSGMVGIFAGFKRKRLKP